MTFEDMDTDNSAMEEAPPPGESSNRTFFIVAGVLGGIMVLALVCLVLYGLLYLPRQRAAETTQAAQINAQNTQIAFIATQTEQAMKWTATPTVTSVLPTSVATNTPVVAVATDTPVGGTVDPRTATVSALLTQAAAAQLTVTPSTTGLPDTGFADDFASGAGIWGLAGLALVLIFVIILARRMRAAS